VRFLKQHREQPFFLYVPFNAPHSASNLNPKIRGAAQAPEKYLKMYPHLKEEYMPRPGHRYAADAETPARETRRLLYLASITCMDDAIGELLDLLDQYKLTENTIVIFFSDNGGGGGSDNGPLKGGKGWMFEGGVRVPCLVRYPKKISAGSVCELFLTSLEIMPTLLKEAGLPLPAGLALDGYDMMPVLADGAPSPRTEMFWQRKEDKAARVGQWKWVESARGNGLFNLATDIGEKNDLSAEHPDKLEEMRAHFSRWRKQMDEAEPRGPFRDY
jgi:arylsulfatase A-like enzyme